MSLAILWLVLLPLHLPWVSLANLPPQSPCERAVIGSDEVLASKSMDVDLDGQLDTVIIHGRSDLFLAIISNSASPDCRVALNTYMIWRDLTSEQQQVTIRAIELVEVTGDDQPELHIALDKRSRRFRTSEAFHGIYMLRNGTWRDILRGTSCLDFSSFEFRDNPNGRGKDIYTDNDYHCDPPFSSGRNYALIRWDGSKFATVESGYKVTNEDQAPWFLPMLCAFGLALILLPSAAVGALAYILMRIITFLAGRARKMAR